MKKELVQLLRQRYPLIFTAPDRPEDGANMWSYFSCEDGWFDLIDTLCACLQISTDRDGEVQVVATQLKEKWGEFRFIARHKSDQQKGMIMMARAMSVRICDQCGKPGNTLVAYGCQHMTRCPEHAPEGAVTQKEFIATCVPQGKWSQRFNYLSE